MNTRHDSHGVSHRGREQDCRLCHPNVVRHKLIRCPKTRMIHRVGCAWLVRAKHMVAWDWAEDKSVTELADWLIENRYSACSLCRPVEKRELMWARLRRDSYYAPLMMA